MVWRRQQHGLVPAAVSLLSLGLVACGASDAISASPSTPTPAISPNACGLLSDSNVAAALAGPASTASPAPSATPATIVHSYSVVARNIGGTKQVGECMWSDTMGGQVIAEVVPATQLTSVADYTTGATQVGGAYIEESTGRGFVSVQHGADVIAITLVVDIDAGVRTVRLANLARTASGAPIPVITPGPSAASSATPSGAANASAPGVVSQNATAASKVNETEALKFNPATVTVKVGDVVEWDNTGPTVHNVTFDASSSLTSPDMSQNAKFQIKWTKAGSYSYHCTFHPGMDGSVTVQ
ncbi:MAG TPA: plastocyanin/azurin family copper-binding protein [Candidatus Dormibacteraeota bacterium]|jgi:plastocyanin|nr:plastocyanin/azurin family copper-binding protein [Candidatus Dormibacteraeota bacterium]